MNKTTKHIIKLNHRGGGYNCHKTEGVGLTSGAEDISLQAVGMKWEDAITLCESAPAMLEALKAAESVLLVAKGLTGEGQDHYDRIIKTGFSAELKLVREAIAIAEGRG